MIRFGMRSLAALGLVAALCLVIGCGEDDVTPPVIPQPPADAREDVIHNLVLAYNKADITQYVKLLHTDYTFYVQERDVVWQGMPEFETREWDVAVTTNMFLAARGLYTDPAYNLDKLALEISDGAWMQVDTVPGIGPCADCWTTTREYHLTLLLIGGAVGYYANDLAQFILIPVEQDGKKIYQIYRVTDLPR